MHCDRQKHFQDSTLILVTVTVQPVHLKIVFHYLSDTEIVAGGVESSKPRMATAASVLGSRTNPLRQRFSVDEVEKVDNSTLEVDHGRMI